MPAYEYTCSTCETTFVRYNVSIGRRDDQSCDTCCAQLDRTEVVETQPGRVDHRFQTHAIMSDGSKVPGHFGVEAKKNKGRY